jgi:hypothetical protein
LKFAFPPGQVAVVCLEISALWPQAWQGNRQVDERDIESFIRIIQVDGLSAFAKVLEKRVRSWLVEATTITARRDLLSFGKRDVCFRGDDGHNYYLWDQRPLYYDSND